MKLYFLLLVFLPVYCFCQRKPKIHFSPAVLLETPKIYTIKRSPNYNPQFDIGLGADIDLIFHKPLSSGKSLISFGPTVGQYFFWNRKSKIDPYYGNYKESNLVSPICLNIQYGNNGLKEIIIGNKATYIHAGLKIGPAYLQNTKHYVDISEIQINKKWTNYAALSFHLLHYNPRWFMPFISLGIEYVNINGKHFRGLFY